MTKHYISEKGYFGDWLVLTCKMDNGQNDTNPNTARSFPGSPENDIVISGISGAFPNCRNV